MPTPPTGLGRIILPYVVSGFEHTFTMYVSNPTLTAGQYFVDKRPDVGGTSLFDDVADDMATAISSALGGGTTPGSAQLEIFDGVLWNPVDTEAVALGGLAGSPVIASQLTVTFRDSGFHHVKPTLMEGNNAAVPAKTTSPTGFAGGIDAFVNEWTPSFTLADAPYLVAVSIWGLYIRSDGFVSMTGTYNRHLRKVRGLA